MEEELPTLKNVIVNDTDEDEPPVLSSQALAALKEFLQEQSQSLTEETKPESEVALVTEDWRLSQFWYDPQTARTISQEVVSLCTDSHHKVACIACPTLYAYLKSKECLEKVAQTISFLAHPKESYLLLLTGGFFIVKSKRLDLMACALQERCSPCQFRPQHSSKLGNEFRLFTNYDPLERLGGWAQEK